MNTRRFTEAVLLVLFDRIRTIRAKAAPVLECLPADGRLTVCRPLGCTECLAHLGLSQAQRQAPDLECFGEFSDLLQVDPVHLAGGGLRVCKSNMYVSFY